MRAAINNAINSPILTDLQQQQFYHQMILLPNLHVQKKKFNEELHTWALFQSSPSNRNPARDDVWLCWLPPAGESTRTPSASSFVNVVLASLLLLADDTLVASEMVVSIAPVEGAYSANLVQKSLG